MDETLPSPDGDSRAILVTVEPYAGPGNVEGRLEVLVVMIGARYPGLPRPHVSVSMAEVGSYDDAISWLVPWFEQEITAALALLGRGIHE